MALETTASIPPRPSPGDLEPTLEQVRRLKEFAPPEPGPLERLMDLPWVKLMTEKWRAGFQDLLDSLRHLFAGMQPGPGELPPYLLEVVSLAAGLLIILFGVFAFYLMLGALRRMLPQPRASAQAAERVVDGVVLQSAAHHQAQAALLARDGRMDAAIRELYLALLCLLEERGILGFEATRSNAEYRQALGHRSELSQVFGGIAGLFEASRYGARPVDSEQYRFCEARYLEALDVFNGGRTSEVSHA